MDTGSPRMQSREQDWICPRAHPTKMSSRAKRGDLVFQPWPESEIASWYSLLAMTIKFHCRQLEKVGRNRIAPNGGIIHATYGGRRFAFPYL
jgi:hypothetical protein